MARNQKEVEDALFQIKNLEESLQRNAQGILSSTMKEEINSLVKESLKEQDEVEDEEEVDVDIEDTDTDNEEFTDDEVYATDDVEDNEMMGQPVMPSDDDTVDMTQASDAEVLRVFRAMGDNDGVIVKRDDNMIHLSDNENDTEYIIQLSESMMDDSELKEFGKAEFDMYSHHFGDEKKDDFSDDFSFGDEEEDDFSDDFSFGDEEEDDFSDDLIMKGGYGAKRSKKGDDYDYSQLDAFDDIDYSSLEEEMEFTADNGETFVRDEPTENIYELELDEDDDIFGGVSTSEKIEFMEDDFADEEEKYLAMMESKGFKPKGVGMGSASKYRMSKKPNMDGGFKTVKKNANKTMGTGKAKFEYKEGENLDGEFKPMKPSMKPSMKKKSEFKEASRTYGNGSKSGRGLRKGITPNRNLTLENERELELLKAKNDEYRKALDLFRTKLNEVAVFNSNLAYATRLFTEHSTTKQEKINILRRFDNVETIKESKNLYRSIKSELDLPKTSENTITESVQRRVEITPSTGSAVNLIESKTYENPQFLRMKDLMAKIK
jgi:hypothetical protein